MFRTENIDVVIIVDLIFILSLYYQLDLIPFILNLIFCMYLKVWKYSFIFFWQAFRIIIC